MKAFAVVPPEATKPEYKAENYTYQSIEHLTKPELISLIDSLLDAKEIDTILVNEIKDYIAIEFSTELYDSTAGASLFPGGTFYNKWDTERAHSYSKMLFQSSSPTQKLILTKHPGDFIQPVVGKITSRFGYRKRGHHNGVDIDLETGEPVCAAFDGVIRIANRQSSYGKLVVIRHYNGLETFYAHLSGLKVISGQTVKAGEIIGVGGNTGRSRGSHLHFETRFKGVPINPEHLISFSNHKMVADSVVLHKTKKNFVVSIQNNKKFHIVRKGESISAITRKYKISKNELCALNNISLKAHLKTGQKLRII